MSSPTLTVNAARVPALSTLLLLCLAATWLIWGSTYLAIKFALLIITPLGSSVDPLQTLICAFVVCANPSQTLGCACRT